MRTAFLAKEPVYTPKVTTAPKTRTSAPTPPKAEKLALTRKPIRFTSKAGIRLKPDESAVLGYWEIAPGINRMVIVTPETKFEG